MIFFQAVNGRNQVFRQEMAEAAQKGEFVRETPKQTVEVTEPVPQKETVETTNGSEVVEPTKPAPSTEVVETAEKDVDNYDVAEEPLTNSTADEEETFQATNLAQENQSKTFQEQVKPAVETASQTVNQFANPTGETFQQASKNLNDTWKKQENPNKPHHVSRRFHPSYPLGSWNDTLGNASDDLAGAGLITALLSVIINFPLVVLLILPALLNKTDKKWPIFILSFLLGWTFIGWIILLAVSINTNKEAERIRQQQMMMQMAGQQGSSDTFNPFQ